MEKLFRVFLHQQLHSAPAPLGAALFTAISAYTGSVPVLVFIGIAGILTTLTALLTPARQHFPERTYSNI